MNTHFRKTRLIVAAVFAGTMLLAAPRTSFGQNYSFNPGYAADAQRNSIRTLRFQLDAFRSAARTAPAYYSGTGYDQIQTHFQAVVSAYQTFKTTLTPTQAANGANDFAELDAGLSIIAEGFTNYQSEAAAGYSGASAFRDLCQTLSRAMDVWSRQFLTVCSRARVPMY